MKINNALLIFLLILMSVPLLDAAVYQKDLPIDLKVPFEVNGSAASPSALCNITITYPNETFMYEDESMTNKNNGFFNFTIPASKTSVLGEYDWTVFCCDGTSCAGGYDEFDVTYNGEKVSLSNIILAGIYGFLVLLFLILAYSFSSDHWMIKTFFNFCALVMGLLAINTGKIVASESLNISRMGEVGIIVMYAVMILFVSYIFIFMTIDVLKALKSKKEIRWDYT